ncbi:MAG: hypothetical protein Q7K35_02285 [bacterium]|nr:hypothetical protein [bacterium]
MGFLSKFFGTQEEPKKTSPLELKQEQEQEEEIKPEHSPEAQAVVSRLDEEIENSQAFLGGLGKVAREEIISNLDGSEDFFDEIYAPKEIGRLGLKAEHDASAFKSAGMGLKVRNKLAEWFSLKAEWFSFKGAVGSKYALEGKKGLVDTRELKKGYKGRERKLKPDELKEAAEKFDLSPEEINQKEYIRTYVKGKEGTEKVVLAEKTAEEMNKAAGEILARHLNKLETETGPNLAKERERHLNKLETETGPNLAKERESLEISIKEREDLEIFREKKEENKKIIDEETLVRLKNQEISWQKKIDEKQEALNREMKKIDEKQEALNLELGYISQPLLERQGFLNERLNGFSVLLEEVTNQEGVYEQEIEDLVDIIRKLQSYKKIGGSLEDEVKKSEKLKAQAEANLKMFRSRKEKLNQRQTKLKRSLDEVNAVLEKINKISKTPAELKVEKTPAEKEPVKSRPGKIELGAKAKMIKIEWPDEGKKLETTEAEAPGSDSTDDNWATEAKERERAGAHEREGIDLENGATSQIAGRVIKVRPKKRETVSPLAKTAVSDRNWTDEKVEEILAEQAANEKRLREVNRAVDEVNELNEAGDSGDEALEERRKIQADQPQVKSGRFKPGETGSESVWSTGKKGFKPKGRMRELNKRPGIETAPVVPPAAIEFTPKQELKERQKVENEKKGTTMKTGIWLFRLFGTEWKYDNVIVNNFKLKGVFDGMVDMTLIQAMNAYGAYIVEANKVEPKDAVETVKRHFTRTFKSNKGIVGEIEVIADNWTELQRQAKIYDTTEDSRPAAPKAEDSTLNDSMEGASAAITTPGEIIIEQPQEPNRSPRRERGKNLPGKGRGNIGQIRSRLAGNNPQSEKGRKNFGGIERGPAVLPEEIKNINGSAEKFKEGLFEQAFAQAGERREAEAAKPAGAIPEAAVTPDAKEAGPEVKFSGEEWQGVFKLENSGKKQREAIKEFFGSKKSNKQLTRAEAIEAYVNYFKKVGGSPEDVNRKNAERIVAEMTK